ncbi:MAG TPA: glycosyltransferase [Roseiarcus sp.]|nr:glycosyltransferase [Roseiarcus sp.]
MAGPWQDNWSRPATPASVTHRAPDRPQRADPHRDGFGRALPPELAFLAQQGLSPEAVSRVFAAVGGGAATLHALLAEGVVREESYYRALARHLGCEYYSGEPWIPEGLDVVRAMQTGVAPLAWSGRGPRAVIAPRPQSVASLIEMTRLGRLNPGSYAVVSPQGLASLLRSRHGEPILAEALGRLPPRLSAKYAMGWGQIAALGLIAAAAVVTGMANIHALLTATSIALWAVFLASIAFRSLATVADNATPRPQPLSDEECPVYTVVAPLYREAEVVEDLVAALDALDYPNAKLDIKLVVEERDHDTLDRLLRMRLPARYEIVVAPPGAPSTKPRALNIAMLTARGEHVVVFDAEDVPAPDQLRLAASRFAADARLDCLQARLTIRNSEDSWLSKLFAAEYAVLFDLVNPGLCALELPISLGGTSNHFRTRSLLDAGCWDEWNVAEDADLGVRLARLGYVVGSLDSDTDEEAPGELWNWFRQRMRWQKGWMQTCIVHSRDPRRFLRELGPLGAASATVLVFGSVLSALFWPFFALDTLWRIFNAPPGGSLAWREATDVFVYLLALAGVWAIVIPAVAAARPRRLKLTAATIALMPAYYLLVSAAAWAAVLDLTARPHYWAKTTHGRTRRRNSRPFWRGDEWLSKGAALET